MAGEGGPIEVNIGECACPGHPHEDGDIVWMRAKPNMDMGLAAQVGLRQSGNYRGDTEGALLAVLVRYGVAAWNCRDAEGPIRVTTDAVVERLGWGDGAIKVAAKARELYWDTVLAPLVPAKSEQPQPTPAALSTSPSQGSGQRTQSSPQPSSHSEPVGGKRSATTGG